ncbi:MAG: hypothetical protein ACXVDK_04240 [Bacteroidia bacterium]
MLKKLSFILFFAAVLIIQSHDVFFHHHDFSHRENDHAEKGHNLFSFVDIDEEYTFQSKTDFTPHVCALALPACFELNAVEIHITGSFAVANDFPPPAPDLSFASLRAPPAHFFC